MTSSESQRTGIRTRDYLSTYVTNAIMMALSLAVFRLAHEFLSEDGFAHYSLLRRTYAFILPAVSLGLPVAIPRYVVRRYADAKDGSHVLYLIAGIFISVAAFGLFCLLTLPLRHEWSRLFFGRAEYAYLMDALIPLVGGSLIHIAAYSYLRGSMHISHSNCLLVANMGLIPVFALFIASDVAAAFRYTGYLTLAASVIVAFWLYRAERLVSHRGIASACRELLIYGIPRVPGDLAYYGLMLAPTTITAHVVGVREAGFVAFGTAIVNMIQQLVRPISTVLLPEATLLIARRDHAGLTRKLVKLLATTIPLTLLITVFYVILARPILNVYLDTPSHELVVATQMIVPSAVLLNVFVLLRSVVDAAYRLPLNGVSSCLSILVYFGSCFALQDNVTGIRGILAAYYVALVVLAGLTVVFVIRAIRPSLDNTASDAC
jgi:O-antigen/teichoic acid export membrane protein